MSFLKTIDSKHFHTEIPYKPMGKYVHFLTIRITESYPLFQTDEELNKARVSAGIEDKTPISRLAMFKRKQSSPERLMGRELMRNYGFMTAEESIANLMKNEFIVHTDFVGNSCDELLQETKAIISNEEQLKAILKQADDEAKKYATKHIKGKQKEKTTINK